MRLTFLYFVIWIFVIVASGTRTSLAHGGGLDGEGCHFNRSIKTSAEENATSENLAPVLPASRPFVSAYHCHHSQAVANYYSQQNGNRVGWYSAHVLQVTDGDTIKVRVHIWLGHSVEINVRIYGIDTPEIRGAACAQEKQKGEASRQALIELVGKEVILYAVRHDKYGNRVLADVYDINLSHIGTMLVEAGHARLYDGRLERGGWCDEEE